MAIIAQKQIFGWQDVEILGDLERLHLVLKYFPDEELVSFFEKQRKNGLNKYPIRPLWNSILAGVVYQHKGIASLRRELLRNAQLRQICGFDILWGEAAIPPLWVYSRFIKKLTKHLDMLEEIFQKIVEKLMLELPDFGKELAIDGKAIKSFGFKPASDTTPDGRRDTDADTGCKSYSGVDSDGRSWEKIKSWFGYKLHLVIDANYELPIAFKVTKASVAEQPIAHELLDKIAKKQPELLKCCESWTADRGYDDGKMVSKLWDEYGIKPVIDIRNCWRDGEETKLVTGTRNVVYNYRGQVFCVCPKTCKQREMSLGGFEAKRNTLKYLCPAQALGFTCEGSKKCPVKKAVRINLNEDRRIFTPLARSSYAWRRVYKKRTAVERVNSRLDVSFGFEEHYVRGQARMEIKCYLALAIMLTLALGRIKEQQPELLRSLVKAA